MSNLAPRVRACAAAATGLGPEDTARFLELHDGYIGAGMKPMQAARQAANDLLAELRKEAQEMSAMLDAAPAVAPAKFAPKSSEADTPDAAAAPVAEAPAAQPEVDAVPAAQPVVEAPVPPKAEDFPDAASYHAAVTAFRRANPVTQGGNAVTPKLDRRAEIKRDLKALQEKYEKRMNRKDGAAPPAIKADALSNIARQMDKLDAKLKRLDEAEAPKKEDPTTHADPGQPAEPATPAVVAEAITKAARKKDEPVADIRAEALRLIDMAIANAPDDKIEVSTSEPRTSNGKTEFTAFKGKAGTDDYISVEVREANDGNWTMHAHEGARSVMVHQFKGGSTAAARRSAESIMLGAAKEGTKTVIQPADKVTIKVPGDGAFTVVNNADRLREFRKVVERSPGFAASKKAKPRIEKAVSSGDLSPNSLAREMLDEGEPLNALEVMDAAGKPMAFGNGGDTGQIPYTDVRDETIDGDAGFFSGHSWSAKKGESRWAVLDKTSGLSLGSGVSRDAALSVAKLNIKKAGAIDKITLARQNPKNKSQEQLRAQFQAEAERKQAATLEAQDRIAAIQAEQNRKDRERDAFYQSIMGKDAKRPVSWDVSEGVLRDFLKAAEKAGKLAEAVKFIEDVASTTYFERVAQPVIKAFERAASGATLEAGNNEIKTGKPPYMLTWDEIEPSIDAQVYVVRNARGEKNYRQWKEAHFEAVKEAVERGWRVPDKVLYDYPTLLRSDLDADAADLASDAMVATYQRTKDYAQAVQAYRDWAPGVDAKGFTVVKGKGGFTLESDDIPDILVYKTKTWDGKDRYQARLKNTTNESGPNLTEQQAIDWAANLRDDMRKAAPAAAPAPAPAAQSSAPAPAPQAPEAPKAQEGAEPAAAPAEAKAEGAPAAAKVENFGEALPPARRNMAAKLDESLSDDDIAKRPFSEIWPLAENEAIEDTFAAAVAHAARAEVPAKPRVAYKLKRWVEAVKTVRELAGMIVSGRTSKAQMADMIVGERATKRSLRDWWSKVLLLEQTPREQWSRIETVEEHPNAISYADGKQVEASHLSVRVDGRSHWLTGDAGVEGKARGTVAGNMDGIRKLLADAEPEKRMKFEIRQNKTTGVIFVNKVGDPESRHLMEFTDAKEARKAINEQYDALVAAWDAVKARDNVTERDLRSAENRPRVGKDHRGGKDVTVEQFAERFGFRGGEFGKWVEQGKGDKERQAILNSAYDALMDLSDILNIPPRAISLNGTLGIAFGSRGSGWASAHFEPSNLVINLTKTRGAGALGHEWFHALDNYFSRLRRDGEGTKFDGDKRKYRDENYITHRPEALMVRKDRSRYFPPMTKSALEAMHERRKHQTDNYAPEKWERDPSAPAQVRPEVEARFAALVEALNDSPMTLRSKALDKGGSGYWASTLERAARAFENYLQARMQEQGYHNDFLANVVPVDDPSYKRSPERYPYLMAGEVKPIAEAFDALFAEVKTRETDSGNVAMFSRTAAAGPGLDLETGRRLAAAFGQAGLVRINVAASADALPSNRRRLQVIGATNVRGAYFPSSDDIWVIADRVHSREEFAFVALHEAFHRGLRKTVPDAAPLLRQMYRTNEALRERVQRVQASLKIGRDEAIEEALADMAGEGKARDLSGWDKLLKLIRGWLAKITDALGVDLTFTDDMIETFVAGVAGEGLKRAPPALPAGAVVHSRVAQTDTPEFKRWFGDSKVVDANGKPLVVYHGTTADFAAFDPDKRGASTRVSDAKKGFFFVASGKAASEFTWSSGNMTGSVMPVYLSMQKPFEVRLPGEWEPGKYDAAIDYAKRDGRDGVIVRGATTLGTPGDVYIAFRPEQIKSAIGNRGTFDPDNADIRLSRVAEAVGDAFNDVRDVRLPAGYLVGDLFNGVGKLSWWHKTVGTMHNLARRSPLFRRVYDAVQSFLNDVSLYATEAADQAPTLLPKLETWRDLGKSPLSAADTKAIAAPIFEGTLTWARDERGRAVKVADLEEQAQAMSAMDKARVLLRAGKLSESVLKMWQGLPLEQFEAILHAKYERDMLAPGVVWSDAELRSKFGLSDAQIGYYREFRRAVDKSLTNLAISDMLRFGGDDVAPVRDRALAAGSADDAAMLLRDHLFEMAEANPDRAKVLNDTANKIVLKADRANDLMKRGYAPLSRFGSHTVYVVDQGEQVYFGMFETPREAARMARQMREQFPDAIIQRGTVSQEEFKLFAGVSPETLALFGEMLGLEQQGDDAASQAFQTYLKLAKNNRSALKRLIHRKGIAGFNEDVGRVLAGFVYSNARQTSSNLHMGEITAGATEIPKGQGELKDAAVRLAEYIKNPQEEAQGLRGLLFAQYLGGSVASALVNMTQPLAVTFPYLSQYGGAKAAAARVARALADLGKPSTGDAALDAALKKAEEEGIVSPQEVHQLMAQARGRATLRAGDGTLAGDAAAGASNALSRLSIGWGKLFGLAEQLNRRATFIAAYRTAVAEGMDDPAAFSKQAVNDTQFVYNKGCVDEATECLTASGWKRHDQLRIGETVFAVDAEGRLVESELEDVHRYTDGPYDATEFRNANGVSMVVTPEHRCLVQNYSSRDKKYQRPKFVRADAIKVGHHFMRTPLGDATGRSEFYTDDEVALFAWVAAEGSLHATRGSIEKRQVRITQSETHNPGYCSEIETLLQRFGGAKSYAYPQRNGTRMWVLRRALSQRIIDALPGKMLTFGLIDKMTPRQMGLFLETFAKADGHIPEEGGATITQKSIRNLDVLQAMAVLSGQSSTKYDRMGRHPFGALYVAKNSKRTQRVALDATPMRLDMVWCPQTKHGSWIARRNGRTFLTGNSKPQWARGAVGSVLFTFKQYSISYVELVHRLWQSGPEGRKAALLMLAVLFLMSGADGLPFADDANDVIDGVLQRLGYNFSTKAAKREFFARALGEDLGRFVEKGVTGLPGVPIDLSGRLGLGNLVPGTGLLVKKADHTRDVAELAGPVADLGKRAFEAAGQLLDGDPLKAAATMSPVAARNVVKAIDMASTGMYRDDRGRKVIDVDGYDAVMKGIGFQPTDVARVQAATSLTQQLIAQNKVREAEIADLWARGLFEGDQEQVQEAREALAQWNRTNPSTPIKIDRQQIRKRVAQMRASKTERLAKTAPKEIRAEVRRELEAAR